MLSFLNKYAKNFYASQNGEEGLILEVLRRLPYQVNEGHHAVEIGGHDGRYCSNSAYLLENEGWSGTFVETQHELWKQCRDNWASNPKVKCVNSHVDKYNVNAFVKPDCDLVSFDTDGGDYQLFKAMKAKPKVVIIEIDSSIEPPSEELNSDGASGYWQTVKLGILKGYFLLAHTGNILMVDNQYRDLFPEIIGDGLSNSELYFKRDWLKKEAA